MKKIFFLLLPFMLIFSSVAQSEALNFSVNWWENEMLTAEGHGRAPLNENNPEQARSFAKRVALLDAYRKLAAEAKKVQITADRTILKTEITAVINGAKITSENFDESGNCSVVLSVPIYGVTNSFVKSVFKPVEKENFPPPSENKIATGIYTGLIIDCGDTELNPVLSPIIRNAANQSIYSYSNLDYDKVIEKGMVKYVKKDFGENVLLLNTTGAKIFKQVGSNIFLANSENTSRAGNNPLIIKAQNIGDDNTCPIISVEDSDKILAENQISHFLDEGSVVFTSNRIRGMRL